MKRQARLTKRERKALSPLRPAPVARSGHAHIHCIACGKHLEESDFEEPATAISLGCKHGSAFDSCVGCVEKSQALIDEHDASGHPVKTAPAYH